MGTWPTNPQWTTTREFTDATYLAIAGGAVTGPLTVENSPVRTFANTPDAGGPGGMIWPDIGIAVSAGDHWQAPSIPVADVARLSQLNIFATDQEIAGRLSVVGQIYAGQCLLAQSLFSNTVANVQIGDPGYGLSAYGSALYLWDPGNGVVLSHGLSVPGTASFTGSVVSNTGYSFGPVVGTVRAGGIDYTSTYARLTALNSGSTQYAGGFSLAGYSSNYSVTATYLSCYHNASGAHIDITGTFTVNGAKNFRIDHPNDKTKWLTHSTIEGPECAVFYRGEAETKDGVAAITLPDYFEALTMMENRSVQLTEIYEGEDEPHFSQLAASRVKDGKFSVRSNSSTVANAVKFYWEVKAVRADISPLEVVSPKSHESHE